MGKKRKVKFNFDGYIETENGTFDEVSAEMQKIVQDAFSLKILENPEKNLFGNHVSFRIDSVKEKKDGNLISKVTKKLGRKKKNEESLDTTPTEKQKRSRKKKDKDPEIEITAF